MVAVAAGIKEDFLLHVLLWVQYIVAAITTRSKTTYKPKLEKGKEKKWNK